MLRAGQAGSEGLCMETSWGRRGGGGSRGTFDPQNPSVASPESSMTMRMRLRECVWPTDLSGRGWFGSLLRRTPWRKLEIAVVPPTPLSLLRAGQAGVGGVSLGSGSGRRGGGGSRGTFGRRGRWVVSPGSSIRTSTAFHDSVCPTDFSGRGCFGSLIRKTPCRKLEIAVAPPTPHPSGVS